MTTQRLKPPATDSEVDVTQDLEQAQSFQTDQVVTVASGHFVHDTYSAFVAPLLPLIQDRLGTGYAATGGLTIFIQLPSLLNPLIGYMADKVSLRYFIILAPAITATLITALGLTSSYVLLALLLFTAGISVAAFHAPAPAMIARVAGAKVGTGMSLFMAAGEMGRTLGPLIIVAAVGWWGLGGVWRLAIAGWIFSAILYLRLRHVSAKPVAQNDTRLRELWPQLQRVYWVLAWIALGRVFMTVSLTTYLPIFMNDVRQGSLWIGAASLTVLEGAGVVGALLTGTLSDRLGRRRILLILFSAAPLLLLMFLYAPGWFAFLLLVALGLTAISPTPVLLALIQDYFPENRAMANGLFLAMSFLIRALGVWTVGLVADGYGLSSAYLWSGLFALVCIPAVFFLPTKAELIPG